MGKVIGFISIKGGVGKTTLALETAACLANHYNKKVLLVDANFSAPNLSLILGLRPELTLNDALLEKQGMHNIITEVHNFDVAPASLVYKENVNILNLKNAIDSVKDRYDYVVLDSAPSYMQLVPVVASCDKLFVVTTPDIPTLHTSLRAARIAKARKTPIEGIIINKVRNPDYELNVNEIEQHSGIPVLARIKDDKNIVESIFKNTPLSILNKGSDFSRELKNFVSALVGSPEDVSFLQRILPFKNFFPKEKVNRELLRQRGF